jgi:hypothetical protein
MRLTAHRLIVRDGLLIGRWHHDHERSNTHRRAPTDYDADHVLLRTVRCVNGEVEVVLDCEPVFDYGRVPAGWEYSGPGYHECVATAEGIGLRFTHLALINAVMHMIHVDQQLELERSPWSDWR